MLLMIPGKEMSRGGGVSEGNDLEQGAGKCHAGGLLLGVGGSKMHSIRSSHRGKINRTVVPKSHVSKTESCHMYACFLHIHL